MVESCYHWPAPTGALKGRHMRIDKALVVVTVLVASGIVALAQQQVGTPGVQAGRDPNRAAFVAANCKT